MTIEEFLIGNGYNFLSRDSGNSGIWSRYHLLKYKNHFYISVDEERKLVILIIEYELRPYFKKMIPHLFEGYFVK